MVDLHSHADRLSVTIRTLPALPGGAWGLYMHNSRTILLRADLGAVQWRTTLAHELGHAFHGHPHPSPAWEAEADEYAVRLVVPRRAFEDHARALHSPIAVAHELGVLPRLVEVAARVYR